MTDAIVIFHFGLFFALSPTKQPDKRKLKKKKKKSPGDIICIIYTTAPKIMIVCYTVPEICDWYNYFSFWVNYCPFTPNSPKNENSKKNEKNSCRYYHVKKCNKNPDHMLYCSWDIACDTCNCYFSFWAIFCPFIPLTTQKIWISKKWNKTPGGIIILHIHVYQKLWLNDVRFLRYGAWRMDRQADGWTDGWKKWHRGGCPT